MSCWTAYLVRDTDRIWRAYGEKHGTWRMSVEQDREQLITTVRKHGWLLHPPPATPFWTGAYCRGVLLDLVDRKLRVFACGCQFLRPACGWIESAERSLVGASIWAGWDVAYAWSRRDDILAAVPEAAGHIEPEPFTKPALDDLAKLANAMPDTEGWLIDWDRASMRLRFRYGPRDLGGLLTVIDEQLEVFDYGCMGVEDGGNVLPWLLHGQPLLDALRLATPSPLPYESDPNGGVIIDCPTRRIRYWSAHSIAHALFGALASAWPGWTIERLTHGYAGHLAATGRRDVELLIGEDELPINDQWGTPLFDQSWVRERATLQLDPRTLRCIEECLDPDG
jgi:hypothetical protein